MERLFFWLGIGLCAAVLSTPLFRFQHRADLEIVFDAAARLKAGEPVYGFRSEGEHTKPPPATLMVVPVSGVNRYWLSRFWDLLNVGALIGLALFFARHLPREPKIPRRDLALLGVLFTLSAWSSEIRMGQYNALLLAALLVATYRKNKIVQGVAFTLALLMKPTNLLFAPWVIRHTEDRKRLVVGSALVGGALLGSYVAWLGYGRLISDHREWLAFLGQSTAAHLMRPDNYGFPHYLALVGIEKGASTILLVIGIGVATWLAWGCRRSLEGFAYTAIVLLLVSPMTWQQNFVLLLPFSILVWYRFFEVPKGARRAVFGASLAVLYFGCQIYNPTTRPWLGGLSIPWPFLGTLGSLVLFLVARYAWPRPSTRLRSAGSSARA